jgi:eukaryotic-like serine/threonine-protein kinase
VVVDLPRRLGSFLLLRHLASGGMGEVFLAHQQLGVAERLCVVKTVRPELAGNRALIRRFVDEARTTALVSHKNVAAVLDVGEDDGTIYIAVEYVAGRDLQDVWKRARRLRQPVPEDVALYVVGELLEALAYVHRATDPRTGASLDIVHRDVSPHNVLVSFEGEVKLIDFGIARSTLRSERTQMGQALGKMRYMSPEQARAEPVDGATDVWAACVVACELLTARRYYGDLSLESVAVLLAAGSPPRAAGGSHAFAQVDPALQQVLAAGLDPERARRPSATEMKERLSEAQRARGTLGSSETLRAYLDRTFAGENVREQRARAALLQEPTVVHAAALRSQTELEETPADELEQLGAADPDAETASRLDPRISAARASAERPATLHHADSAEERTGTAPSQLSDGPPKSAPSTASLVVLGAIAIIVLSALGTALATTILDDRGLRPADARPPPASTRVAAELAELPPGDESAPLMDAPLMDAPPMDATPMDVTPMDATPMDATIGAGEPVGPAPGTRASPARPPSGERPRGRADKREPQLFGDRVRALKECNPRPLCASAVLPRVAHVPRLSVEELKELDAEVDRCLSRCRAR